MPRLIHLNGPPGVGKSTLARRYVADHPGVLCLDVDVLRSMVGGWRDDFLGTGAIVRPTALAMIGSHLAGGRDVVMPQLLAAPAEIDRFEAACTGAGGAFVEVVLLDADPRADVVARFERRGAEEPDDPWHHEVRLVAAANGGEEMLRRVERSLHLVLQRRPGAVRVPSAEGDVEGTYARLLEVLGEAGPGASRAVGPGAG